MGHILCESVTWPEEDIREYLVPIHSATFSYTTLEQGTGLNLYQVFWMTIKTLMDILISVIKMVITKDENTLSKNTVHLFSL